MPWCDTQAMNAHLMAISGEVDPGAHAVLILDLAGWHSSAKLIVPDNITLLFLPPRSPELNPSKMSGSSCATTGCQTGSSHPTTTSSITAAPLGTSSSTNPGRSCQSECGTGTSVLTNADWYE